MTICCFPTPIAAAFVTGPQLEQMFAKGGVLVDGFVAGAWKIARAGRNGAHAREVRFLS
jgi:hypothetical protein